MKLPAWLSRWLPGRRRGLRRFEAAQYNRLTHSWVGAECSINTELRGDLDALRRRARDLARNSPLAKKFLKMCVDNIVGPKGFTLQARVVDPAGTADTWANAAIEAGWADWGRAVYCDVGGRLSFRQFCRAAVRALARDGEAMIRQRFAADNPYGYAVQLLDIKRLDTTLNREPEPGRNQIIMGVEMDGDGRPVNYWILAAAVGRDPTGRRHQVIPAREILHVYITDDPEQARGVPWMHAVMLPINDIKGYNHAAIVAARVGASKMGFFTSPDGDATALADGESAPGIPFTSAEPGEFGMAPPGYDFKSFDPDYPHANYASFIKEHKRDVASGLGVAYNALANDLEGVNFSSIRSGTLEERDGWMTAQDEVIEMLCEPIYANWIDSALLSGAILLPNGSALPAAKRSKFAAHEFTGRRWQWVDPLKDVEASVKAIENGLASPYSIAAQQGLDAEDVLDDIARFQAAAKAKGVTLGAPQAPAPEPKNPQEDDPAVKAAKLVADATKYAADRSLESARGAPPAQTHIHLPPPPAVNVSTHPEIKADIHVPPAAAPIVEIRNEITTPEQAAPTVEVHVEARMPEQAAPVVEVNVEIPAETTTHIASMPDRVTTSTVERDAKTGNIKTTRQTERDA